MSDQKKLFAEFTEAELEKSKAIELSVEEMVVRSFDSTFPINTRNVYLTMAALFHVAGHLGASIGLKIPESVYLATEEIMSAERCVALRLLDQMDELAKALVGGPSGPSQN